MNPLIQTYTLANGVPIPRVGFGTWQIPDGPPTYDAVRTALDAGYRHIDTAASYRNEGSVGRAIRDSGIDRDELFVTTKLVAEIKDGDAARRAFERSTQTLDLGEIDLYLIHAPWPWAETGADYRAGNIEVWRVFEELYGAGRVRSIGVSNFDVGDLESLVAATDVVPHANQIRWFVGSTEPETSAWCVENDVLVEAYSPLATGRLLHDERLTSMAERYGITPAQLSLRYVLQHGALPLPKAVTPDRIRENAQLDVEISVEDVRALDGLSNSVD